MTCGNDFPKIKMEVKIISLLRITNYLFDTISGSKVIDRNIQISWGDREASTSYSSHHSSGGTSKRRKYDEEDTISRGCCWYARWGGRQLARAPSGLVGGGAGQSQQLLLLLPRLIYPKFYTNTRRVLPTSYCMPLPSSSTVGSSRISRSSSSSSSSSPEEARCLLRPQLLWLVLASTSRQQYQYCSTTTLRLPVRSTTGSRQECVATSSSFIL